MGTRTVIQICTTVKGGEHYGSLLESVGCMKKMISDSYAEYTLPVGWKIKGSHIIDDKRNQRIYVYTKFDPWDSVYIASLRNEPYIVMPKQTSFEKEEMKVISKFETLMCNARSWRMYRYERPYAMNISIDFVKKAEQLYDEMSVEMREKYNISKPSCDANV
jgi:hypothetical protein